MVLKGPAYGWKSKKQLLSEGRAGRAGMPILDELATAEEGENRSGSWGGGAGLIVKDCGRQVKKDRLEDCRREGFGAGRLPILDDLLGEEGEGEVDEEERQEGAPTIRPERKEGPLTLRAEWVDGKKEEKGGERKGKERVRKELLGQGEGLVLRHGSSEETLEQEGEEEEEERRGEEEVKEEREEEGDRGHR